MLPSAAALSRHGRLAKAAVHWRGSALPSCPAGALGCVVHHRKVGYCRKVYPFYPAWVCRGLRLGSGRYPHISKLLALRYEGQFCSKSPLEGEQSQNCIAKRHKPHAAATPLSYAYEEWQQNRRRKSADFFIGTHSRCGGNGACCPVRAAAGSPRQFPIAAKSRKAVAAIGNVKKGFYHQGQGLRKRQSRP